MADWVTISSLATAGGTMVLALATFSSVRSANRSARIAEQSLLVGLRPVLVPSRPEDPPERVTFVERGFVVNGGDLHPLSTRDDILAVHLDGANSDPPAFDAYLNAITVRHVGVLARRRFCLWVSLSVA